jgi:sugar phosphate isomerase/epimerase
MADHKMKLSCSNLMVPGHSLTEKATLLKSWGYSGMAIFIDHHDWNDALHEEIIDLEHKTGITPCEFVLVGQLYGHLMDDDLDLRARSKAIYLQAGAVCAGIGANTSVEFEYKSQDPMPLFNPHQRLSPEKSTEFADIYREILSTVQSTRGHVLIEPLNRYESAALNTVAECSELLRDMDAPNSGLLFDFFHCSIEEKNLIDSIHLAGDLIRHVHLGDNNRLLPGRGNINWKRCFGALADIGYTGFINLECSTSGDAHRTLPEVADYIRSIIAG